MDTRKKIIIASLIVILIILTAGIFWVTKKKQQQTNNSTDTGEFPGMNRPSPIPQPIPGNTTTTTDTGSSTTSSSSGTSLTTTPASQEPATNSDSPEGTGVGITIPPDQSLSGGNQSTSGNTLGSGLNANTAISTTPALSAITPTTDPIENITPTAVQPSLNPDDAALVLKPLPVDNPATSINERDVEMKKRIFDVVWRKWDQDPQKVLANKDRQRLYGEFSSIKQNITDAKSLVNSKNLLESIKLQNVDLANGYHDCMIIRDAAVKKNPGTGKPYLSTDTAFWDGIRAQMLTLSLKASLNPSISIIGTSEKHPYTPSNGSQIQDILNKISFAENDPFWKNFNELTDAEEFPGDGSAGSWSNESNRKPQVYQAMNAEELLQQDRAKTLFCKLPNYFFSYWAPDKLTGWPIGCFSNAVDGNLLTNGKKATPNFYDVNISEIFYNPGNTGL